MNNKQFYVDNMILAIKSCSFAPKLITDRNITISTQTSLIQDIAIVSIQLIEYLIKLEALLGMELDFEELSIELIDKIDSFADYLCSKQN